MIKPVIPSKRPDLTTREAGPSHHGGGVRGDNSAPRSPLFEGSFGRIFRSLPPAEWPEGALRELGRAMTAKPERDPEDRSLPAAAPEIDSERIHDDEENSGIGAGYTYLGQFIDHDITFDPASSLQQQNDPDSLVDFRTPRLDLDSLYGRGPEDQPYLYDGKKFRLGRPLLEFKKRTAVRDVPRFAGADGVKRALIGDKRNDENVIISQLHAAMLQFHNKLADGNPRASFKEIQRLVRWHYQWVVLNDFLVTICGRETVQDILPHLGKNQPIWKNQPEFTFYRWREYPFIPIEFSAAAYRFGHSMVRPIYRLNTQLRGGDREEASRSEKHRGIAGRFFIFAGVTDRGLNGFREFPKQWAIDWSLFFDIAGSLNRGGKQRVQPAYKIDTSLVNPLGFLPEFSEPAAKLTPPLTIKQLQSRQRRNGQGPANLATRNLLRGMAMGLPSGQDVARAMGLVPIKDENLRVGKAVIEDWDRRNPRLDRIDRSFKGKAPLWYYVLAEAQYEWMLRARKGSGNQEPLRLGTLGGRIVAETLIGLLWFDGTSYLRQAPNWQPDKIRSMGDLIATALN